MNRIRCSDESGLAGKILVGVVAWALGAVLLLTSTLITAQQIDTRVNRITHTVGPIDHDLDSVALAAETNRIAGEIQTAAKPLSGQADQIIAATGSIDTSAKSINSDVLQIGDSVNGIARDAGSINSNVTEINKTVKDINGTAKAISGTVNQIDGNVASIGGTVHGIDGNLSSVLETARSIRGDHVAPGSAFGSGIAGIDRRADMVIALVQSIKADTGNILASARNIEASAKSIEGKIDQLTRPTAGLRERGTSPSPGRRHWRVSENRPSAAPGTRS
jgi:methyl-accepting chemotaxis protein